MYGQLVVGEDVLVLATHTEVLVSATVATLVAVLIGGSITAARYVFGVELVTKPQLEDQLEANVEAREAQDERFEKQFDEINEQLRELRELIMGSEFQVSDGMLEIVEMNRESIDEHGERISDVERIQLKIRRRQEHDHDGPEEPGPQEDEAGGD